MVHSTLGSSVGQIPGRTAVDWHTRTSQQYPASWPGNGQQALQPASAWQQRAVSLERGQHAKTPQGGGFCLQYQQHQYLSVHKHVHLMQCAGPEAHLSTYGGGAGPPATQCCQLTHMYS